MSGKYGHNVFTCLLGTILRYQTYGSKSSYPLLMWCLRSTKLCYLTCTEYNNIIFEGWHDWAPKYFPRIEPCSPKHHTTRCQNKKERFITYAVSLYIVRIFPSKLYIVVEISLLEIRRPNLQRALTQKNAKTITKKKDFFSKCSLGNPLITLYQLSNFGAPSCSGF